MLIKSWYSRILFLLLISKHKRKDYKVYIVSYRPIVGECIRKEPHNIYENNNRLDTFLGNAHNTRTKQ